MIILRGGGYEENYSLYDLQLKQNPKDIIFVSGWGFRCYKYVYEYKDFFREKYYPKVSFSEDFHSIQDKMKDYDIKVGIHIRRGDYEGWRGGKYFYDDAIYESYMQDFMRLNEGRKILFIIFSNGEINLKTSLNFVLSKCIWYEDHTLMSLCDYIIGAPSTFSLWASFMGDVPVFQIRDKNQRLEMSLFSKEIERMMDY